MDIGTKVRFVNQDPSAPVRTATVVRPSPREAQKKGKRTDGTIVPKVFLEIDNEFKTRAWFPTEWVEPIA